MCGGFSNATAKDVPRRGRQRSEIRNQKSEKSPELPHPWFPRARHGGDNAFRSGAAAYHPEVLSDF
jgi:hypothetical protein